MKIIFTLKDGNRLNDSHVISGLWPQLYYECYFADVDIHFENEIEHIPNVPMIYFIAVLEQLMVESLISSRQVEQDLWDTGYKLSLEIEEGGFVALEIPKGTKTLRYPTWEFILALKNVSLEMLWVLYDDNSKLLSAGNIFHAGSALHKAAQLISAGNLARNEK